MDDQRTHESDRQDLRDISYEAARRARNKLVDLCVFLTIQQHYNVGTIRMIAGMMSEVLPNLRRECDDPFYRLRMCSEDLCACFGDADADPRTALRGIQLALILIYANRVDGTR